MNAFQMINIILIIETITDQHISDSKQTFLSVN
jgi:hypothetical protein